MNISQEKKAEIRRKIIEAAVDIITEKGFGSATMREIAAKAGVGSATIYNYFPVKEKILYAYFEETQKNLSASVRSIPEFESFTLKEKLQAHLEGLLDLYRNDREFVQQAYGIMFDSPLRTFSEFIPIRDQFTGTVRAFIEEAIERNEIADHPFMGFINNLYWDYAGLIIMYWLKDESEGFSNTSQMIDMSLDIIVDVLRSGIIIRLADMAGFIFRSHIYNNFHSVTRFFSSSGVFSDLFNGNAKNRTRE